MLESKKKVLLWGGYAILFAISIMIGIQIGNIVTQNKTKSDKLHILCLGVDKFVPLSERDPITNSVGQADAIYLVTIDKKNEEVSIVAIPRDTMVLIEKYNSNMEYLGNEMGQICIQYAYADGTTRSCELTCDRVESLFHGVEIDAYVAININAIMALNDAIGGVEVTIHDDYTSYQMSEWKGVPVLLDGEAAMNFLRVRDCTQSETAYGRLERIKEYIQAFIPKAITSIKEHPVTVKKMYDALSENMLMDVAFSDIISMAGVLLHMSAEDITFYTLEGTIQTGVTGYEEFYPNINQLIEINYKIQ